MSTILIYQADINGGHYALHTIGAGTIETIAMNAASYNNVEIKPKRVYIGNYANPANITVTMQGGLQTIVPAYTNSYVSVQGYPVIDISNPGVESVQIMSVDEKMIPFAEDTFATLTVQGASSNNDILNHFNGTLSQNEGFLEGVSYTVGADINFTADKKFGETAANFKAGHGGLVLYKSDYFDMSKDFCVDFWLKVPTLTNTIILQFFADADTLVQNTTRLTLTAAGGMSLLINNTAADVTTAISKIVINTYHHIALTKEGGQWNIFIDGVQEATVSKTNIAIESYMSLMYGRIGNLPTRGFVDELRVRWGSALWTSAFTPPTEPYD